MHTSPFADWDGTAQRARVLQNALAERVLLDADTLQLLAHSVARTPTSMPYVPGLLSFRELPALLQALRELPQVPDLIYCDGMGIAHPRRLGIASHLGVVTGCRPSAWPRRFWSAPMKSCRSSGARACHSSMRANRSAGCCAARTRSSR